MSRTDHEIPLFRIYWDDEDVRSVETVIRSGMHWCLGKQIEDFEQMIRERLDMKYCLTFNSGGSALYALMLAYKFGPTDEIVVPSFTFVATGYAPMYVGARPVFADVEFDTFGLDSNDVENRLTPKTKAIMPIHYGGIPCGIEELREIADRHNLLLIEDAAESFGARFKGQLVGTFGDSAIFSFCQNKTFTTSEGGCVVTNNEEICERLRLIRSYGRVVRGDYFQNAENIDYVDIGFNFRMSTLLAVLGISQLKKLDRAIQLRRSNAEYLNARLVRLPDVVPPEPPSEHHFCTYQMYTIRLLRGSSTRDKLLAFLKQKGITTRIYFDPVHRYSIFKRSGYGNVSLEKTEKLASQVLTLPMYPGLTRHQLDYIVENVANFLEMPT